MAAKIKELSLSILLTFSLLSLSLSNPDFTALLVFKSSSSDPYNSLSSWLNSSSSSVDHCSWLGVTCNPATHRVTKLVLNDLNITGSIEPLARLSQLRHLSLHGNRLSSSGGTTNFTSWRNLKQLYLSHNLLAGKFPDGISGLLRLRRLDLSYNQFSGGIPVTELTRLPHLLTLRLEFNSFTGTLGSTELPSTSISDFNVSGNDLAGKIPTWLSKFPPSSFAGNKNLCGDPLPDVCPNQTIKSNRTAGGDSVQNVVPAGGQKRRLSNRAVLTILSIDVVAVMAAVSTLACYCYRRGYRCRERKREEEKREERFPSSRRGVIEREEGEEEMVYFEGCNGFTKVDDLLKGSAEMLGKGIAGTTYKVVMDGGDVVVVVKRVRERSKRKKEVDGFLRVMGGLRHPNIVSLRAYHSSKDELLLVYDFLPSGSLHSLLHGNRGPGRSPLDWRTRLKLASGSAQGLAFLHSHNNSSKLLFHGHLTTSNIIVDQLGNACLSDIGLHQLLQSPSPSSSSPNPYRAPELKQSSNGSSSSSNQNGKFMQRCDVYSLGAVLLEILTGKVGGGSEGEDDDGLGKWVQGMVNEKGTWEVFDFELLRNREREEEMVALLEVALLCLAPSPRDRPKMGDVHEMIEGIRIRGRGSRSSSPTTANDLSSDSSPSLSDGTPNFIAS